MSGHVDLLKDVGPEGPRTAEARRHLVTCGDCRRRVTAVQKLVRLARHGGSSASALPQGNVCLSTDEVLQATEGTARTPERIRAHLSICGDCAAVVDEARTAMSSTLGPRQLVRVPPMPPGLRARIRALQLALPLAAIPVDITRASSSKSTLPADSTKRVKSPRASKTKTRKGKRRRS